MAHPSQKARKARSRNKTSLQSKIQQAHAKNSQLAGLAIAAHNQSAHLARLLTYVVANYGVKGVLKIDDSKLAEMPDGAQLQELYERETDSIILTAIVRVAGPVPPTEVLTGTDESLLIIDEEGDVDPAALDPRNRIKLVTS